MVRAGDPRALTQNRRAGRRRLALSVTGGCRAGLRGPPGSAGEHLRARRERHAPPAPASAAAATPWGGQGARPCRARRARRLRESPASPCPRVHVRRRRRDEPSTRRRPLCAGTRHAGRARSAPGGHTARGVCHCRPRRLTVEPPPGPDAAPRDHRDPEIGRPPPAPPVLWMRILSLCKSAKGVKGHLLFSHYFWPVGP